MTTRTELLEIIANGENSGVEFKRDDELKPEALAKELVAFTNTYGGKLLLGVEDDGTVTGLKREDAGEWVVNICRAKIRPEIVPFFEIVKNVSDDRDVAIVRVPSGYSVHALWHNDTRRYLIRADTQSLDASGEELARLFQQKGSIRAELMPVSGATFADLDRRRLRYYFGGILDQEIPDDQDEPAWKKLLVNTELMSEKNDDLISEDGVTVGGMLLFGKTPNRFLPQSGFSAFAFQGVEKDYDTRERKPLRGPMTPLLDEAGDMVENGLVEQALEFVRRNTPVSTRVDGGRRLPIPTYPDQVLREGIVNALVHRDYLLTSTDIELSVYSDRLEIVSPGRLPNGITPDRMLVGTRTHRNQLLMNVMSAYHYSESMGMGVLKKIVPGMKAHNRTEPELVADYERFTLRLLAKPPSFR